ncbi:MAG: Asp23/Gls24 family envelope stress response protein [Candidatus Hydrogenedentota bacterium]
MNDSVALGKHEVDLAVYAKVAAYETQRQEGVVRMSAGFSGRLGMTKVPGVVSRLEEDGSLRLDISVIVHYGADLRSLGPAIQESVLTGIRGMSDQPVGQINVYIADVEFDNNAAPAPPLSERNAG